MSCVFGKWKRHFLSVRVVCVVSYIERAEEIVLENKLDYVLLTLLATNEPTMNYIPTELKKLTIITAAVALAEALDRRRLGCGNGRVEVWWTRRLWLWHLWQ